MGEITTVGIDLAKNVVSVHGVDAHGKTETVLRKAVSRGALLELMAQLPQCLVGMEACSVAHQLARELQPLGHQPRIMMPKFINPYRRSWPLVGRSEQRHAGSRPPPLQRERPNTASRIASTCCRRWRTSVAVASRPIGVGSIAASR